MRDLPNNNSNSKSKVSFKLKAIPTSKVPVQQSQFPLQQPEELPTQSYISKHWSKNERLYTNYNYNKPITLCKWLEQKLGLGHAGFARSSWFH